MATLTKTTLSKDAKGFLSTEEVWESFSTIAPSTTAKTYSISQDDGKFQLTQTFVDEIPNPDPEGPPLVFPESWSVEVSTSLEPIEGHPRFSVFTPAQWAQYLLWRNCQFDKLVPEGWTPATQLGDLGATLEDAINRNTTTYYSPRVVIKHSFTSTVRPDLSNIGKINFPSFATGMTPSGMNFIVTGCACVQEGNKYKLSYEWLGSGPGGWSPFFYNA